MKLFDMNAKSFWPVIVLCAGALVFAACGKPGKDEAAAGETASTPTADPYAGWVEYISDPMGFTVMAPKPMELSQEKSETADGPTDINYFMAEMGPVTYGVICNDFSAEFTAKIDRKEFLDKGVKGFVDKLAGTLTAERNVTLGEYTGREIEMTGSSQGAALYGKARFFLVGTRLFQLAYIAEQGKEDAGAVDHFLNSFKLR
jgi:hypothetical protein